MEELDFELKREISLNTLTNNVVKSSALEGKNLNSEAVRSSIARRLGINIAGLITANQEIEGMVEMMLDATQMFSKPLTRERLFNWHAALFPAVRSDMHHITVGKWRTIDSSPMQVISSPIDHKRTYFDTSSANRLDSEMKAFLTWFDKQHDIDPVLKAGIAHLWFVTIHPFEDGNDRISMAIIDMALARADSISDRFYSLSNQIELEHKNYYHQLEKQQRSTPEITKWLIWFLNCLGRTISSAEITLSKVLFESRLRNKINQRPVNKRQSIVINSMLEDDFRGYISTSKYAKLAKCSNDTAFRDIQALKERGIFIQNSRVGRSTSY